MAEFRDDNTYGWDDDEIQRLNDVWSQIVEDENLIEGTAEYKWRQEQMLVEASMRTGPFA